MPYTLHQNIEASRFEVFHQNLIAFVKYKLNKNEMGLLHTEVPGELGSKGLGTFLAKNVLAYAKNHGLKVKPYCPFIKAYIDRHEEYQSISAFH